MNDSGKARQIEEKKDILSDVLTNVKDCSTLSALFVHPFCLCGQNLNRNACFFSLLCACPQVSEYCVFVFVCVSMMCVYVCVCDSLPLMYVPSFVSEDYSFPFEVMQLARRGRSERRPRAGFHTSPTAACRLGGKYVCRQQRHREGKTRRVTEEWRERENGKAERRVINAG